MISNRDFYAIHLHKLSLNVKHQSRLFYKYLTYRVKPTYLESSSLFKSFILAGVILVALG